MKGTTNESSTGRTNFQNASGQGNWNIHPAFNYGSEVAGIWVAKYEASKSDSSTSSMGSSDSIKIQPTVQSWRNIIVNDIYTKCLNYNTTLNSHMMKNMEWGAVAYLCQSLYGKNSEVWINNSSSYITGSAGNGASAVADVGTTNDYKSSQGVQASTTGNVYGVYDMSGGAWEYMAAYINNEQSITSTTGKTLIEGAKKTKDVYEYNKNEGDEWNHNFIVNSAIYGDSVYETSMVVEDINSSWYFDYSQFPCYINSFFSRGGNYESTNGGAGTFSLTGASSLQSTALGFRPVLCVM